MDRQKFIYLLYSEHNHTGCLLISNVKGNMCNLRICNKFFFISFQNFSENVNFDKQREIKINTNTYFGILSSYD